MINLLSNNPYRVLGVYSNSPKKDVLSNLNKMKAFLKVGKAVSFPLDLPQFLPSIERDEAIVSSAQTSIELPMDQIKHTLFWFMKVTPLDDIALNHMLAGNMAQAKEIWNKKESVSSLLNLMACAVIEGDLDAMAIKADTLFQKYSGDFCLAVNEIIKLGPAELTGLYIDLLKKDGSYDLAKMMQVSGTSAEWRKITGSGLVKPVVDKITLAISDAKSAKGASANYRAGEKLMNSTKGLLFQLRSFLGTSDMQYQMIADKLATTILQCGINYFNDTEEDDAVEKAMRIQNYALSIAVGQMAKDRCKENVDILKKNGPEYKVQKELNRIGENLKLFSTKPVGRDAIFTSLLGNGKSFSDINSFIDGCKSDLLTVRQNLGASNSLYLKISSAVASAAINAMVEKINATQQMANITSDKDSLKRAVSSAISTMYKISSLDMTTECRNYFNRNNSTLNNINSQLNPSGGCYIATMAYGDYDHPQVMVLRQFRDSYLFKRNWGKKFINFYYANSPRWVELLKDHKRTNILIRKLLDAFIYILKKMDKIFLLLFFLAGLICYAEADDMEILSVNDKVVQLVQNVDSLAKENQRLKNNVTELQRGITGLHKQISALGIKRDSVDNVLMNSVSSNTELANRNHVLAIEKIQVVETASRTDIHQLTVWGIWAIVVLLIVAMVIYVVLHRGISKGTEAISSIRAAQDGLETESLKLDTKLVELLDKQLSIEKNQVKANIDVAQQVATPDHSLALKVADEITRIEKNLSRMDSSVKGYKPLVKAIDRIKDNFKANGYEIVTYLGQPYTEGMRINPEFVIDEILPAGTRIITSVSKPQVHFNGELIQKASVTVSQNI